jgi:hypothetical protein
LKLAARIRPGGYRIEGIEDSHLPLGCCRRRSVSAIASRPRIGWSAAALLEIADLLGHRTLAMVKRYSHVVIDHKARVIERMIVARGL